MFNYYWATGRIIFPRFHCGSGSNGSLEKKKRDTLQAVRAN